MNVALPGVRGTRRGRTQAQCASVRAGELNEGSVTQMVRVLEAPSLRKVGRAAEVSLFPAREQIIDLRAAAVSDDRETQVRRALEQLRAAVLVGGTVELTWPTDRDASHAATYLGAPLALLVSGAVAGTTGSLVIHTRTGTEAEFLLSPPTDRITFVFHLNSEEAAMRWERGDAAPARRLAAAAHLRNAGWQVWACVGPVRLFSGWRDEYRDLAERATAAGVQRLLVSFPGEDAFDLGPVEDVDGLDTVAAGNGYTFSISARHRRDVHALLSECMSAQSAAEAAQGGRSSQVQGPGSRNRRPHFGVRVPTSTRSAPPARL